MGCSRRWVKVREFSLLDGGMGRRVKGVRHQRPGSEFRRRAKVFHLR